MIRRRLPTAVALALSAALLAALLLGPAAVLGGGPFADATAGAQPVSELPLLPLARGQLLLTLGAPPQWLPVSGEPLTVTLFAGERERGTKPVNAYVGFQSVGRACPATPRGDHSHLLTIADYYEAAHRITSSSAFAPGGGTRRGDYEVDVPDVIIHGTSEIRACIWLSRSPRDRSSATVQDLPLLNGLFAASVSNIPSAESGAGRAYTLDAVEVGRSFSYEAQTASCAARTHHSETVLAGALASDVVSFVGRACPNDQSMFTFTARRTALGALTYTEAEATATPPYVAALGGCELDPVAGVSLANAESYVTADGCLDGRVLIAPYAPGVRRGAVTEAQVDGAVAELAPPGTAIDLVLNGRP